MPFLLVSHRAQLNTTIAATAIKLDRMLTRMSVHTRGWAESTDRRTTFASVMNKIAPGIVGPNASALVERPAERLRRVGHIGVTSTDRSFENSRGAAVGHL